MVEFDKFILVDSYKSLGPNNSNNLLSESELTYSTFFFPVSFDELRNPHVTIPYRISVGFEESDRFAISTLILKGIYQCLIY